MCTVEFCGWVHCLKPWLERMALSHGHVCIHLLSLSRCCGTEQPLLWYLYQCSPFGPCRQGTLVCRKKKALSLKTKKKRQEECKSGQCWTSLPDWPVLGQGLASSPLLFSFTSLHFFPGIPKHLHLLKDLVMHTLCHKSKEQTLFPFS